jgi:hypothetical protein
MPDWLIWMVIAFAIMGCGRSCGRRMHGYGRYHRERMRDRREEMRAVGPRARTQLADGPPEWEHTSVSQRPRKAASSPAPPPRRETPLQALQRRFVDGSLSLEQYESEVDKLKRLD